ncbi:MAG TPA: hypothetical protein VNX68_07385, partial [Nitrosopumilaceae archaeon]|nr:hypothetical protein [Nitrosopumilaceae archaeon]
EKAEKASDEVRKLQQQTLDKTSELADAYKSISLLQEELKNQVTGGGNTPILQLTIYDYFVPQELPVSEKIHVCVMQFSIVNSGKYPLQDVKFQSRDANGEDVLKYRAEREPENEVLFKELYKKFKTIEWHEVGTIPKNTTIDVYTSYVSPEICKFRDGTGFGGFLTWGQGSISYEGIGFKIGDKGVVVDGVTLMVNGVRQKDYQKYVTIKYAR